MSDDKIIIINKFEKLIEMVDSFINGNDIIKEILIKNCLRKPIRQFKELYPNLYYFAYGLGHEYNLVLSKNNIKIASFKSKVCIRRYKKSIFY